MIYNLTHNPDGSPKGRSVVTLKVGHGEGNYGQGSKNLDYFMVRPVDKNGRFSNDAAMIGRVHEKLGLPARPLDIPIYLISNNIEKMLTTELQAPNGNGQGLLCRGNGAVAVRNFSNGLTVENFFCRPRVCPDFLNKACKSKARFYFSLRGGPQVGSVAAYWTTSTAGTLNIMNFLTDLKNRVAQVVGPEKAFLQFLPVRMRLTKITASVNGANIPQSVVYLTLDNADYQDGFENHVRSVLAENPFLTNAGIDVEPISLEAEWTATADEFDGALTLTEELTLPSEIVSLIDELPALSAKSWLNFLAGFNQAGFTEKYEEISAQLRKTVNMFRESDAVFIHNGILVPRQVVDLFDELPHPVQHDIYRRMLNLADQKAFDNAVHKIISVLNSELAKMPAKQ